MNRLQKAALLLLITTACSTTGLTPPKEQEFYLQEAEKLFEKGRFEEAVTAWEKVREGFYSPELNALADLKIAEAHFLAKNYLEAAAAYEEFLKQHPGHEQTPRVLFQLGLSYFRQMLSADRDQAATRNAVATFEQLLKSYPETSHREEVREMIRQAKDRLAAHELYVGHFYLRTDRYKAAIDRLSGIPPQYPDFSDRDQVLYLLAQAYLGKGELEKARETLNTLINKYPDSVRADAARKLLDRQ